MSHHDFSIRITILIEKSRNHDGTQYIILLTAAITSYLENHL